MPDSFIIQSQKENLDYSKMFLWPSQVIIVESRDKVEDVKEVKERIERNTHWLSLGDEGERIQKVLSHIDPYDYWASFKAWGEYFEQILTFPFEAVVSKYQKRGPLREGDKASIQNSITP